MEQYQESKSDVGSQVIPGVPIKGVSSWNLLQNRIALLGSVLIVLLILIPPWEAAAPNGMTGSIGHYPIFSSEPAKEWKYPELIINALHWRSPAL